MSDAPHLILREENDILIATLNRPEKLNALSNSLMRNLEEAVYRFRDTPRFKVMLVRAVGRYFSAGADMKEADTRMPPTGSGIREEHRIRIRGMRRVWDELEAIEKPIVAAHQGPCIGGGLEMSLSCDFRLASTSARYGFPEGKFAVLPATNGISRLTRVVGTHWARYLVMGNLEVDAERALIMGLIHDIYPAETFDEDVMRFCRHLAKQNGEQMGTAKLAIELAADLDRAQAGNVERMANSALMLMPQYMESVTRHVASIGRAEKNEQ